MIKPTVGRSIHYKADPINNPELTFAAIIAAVHSDMYITLTVFGSDGVPFARPSVQLVQDGETPPPYPYATWMPFQVGQAKALEITSIIGLVGNADGSVSPSLTGLVDTQTQPLFQDTQPAVALISETQAN